MGDEAGWADQAQLTAASGFGLIAYWVLRAYAAL
jgi:hypothetical protein